MTTLEHIGMIALYMGGTFLALAFIAFIACVILNLFDPYED